jgi:hypothetical protein
MDQDSTFATCYLMWLIHTSHSPNIPTTKTLLGHPMMFLVLVCAQNSHGCHGSCLQSSFTCIVKKFWSPSSLTDPEYCHHQVNLGTIATKQQDASPQGRPRAPPFLGQNVISQMIPKLLQLITFW